MLNQQLTRTRRVSHLFAIHIGHHGEVRRVEHRVAERGVESCCCVLHERRMKGTTDRQWQAPLRARLLAEFHRAFDTRDVPGNDHLFAAVEIGRDHKASLPRCLRADRFDRCSQHAEHGRHRSGSDHALLEHQRSAPPHEARGFSDIEHACDMVSRELA